MIKPTILAVDDDPAVSRAATRDLRSRYGANYRIVRATSGVQALEVLAELALRDRPVALVASDQRMPEMTGVELLEQVRRQSPTSKLLLLTAYASLLSMTVLLAEVKESTRRISGLVAAVRSYSQLDRASGQQLDVAEGLESTLVMLAHELGGVRVVRD